MRRTTVSILAFLTAATAVLAASPPPLLNYQGVLRSAGGARLEGSFDLVFRFYDDSDPALPENEILLDSHTAAGVNAVTVTGGVFNVVLGSGTVTDGAGAGTYTDLGDLFGAFNPVYLEIKVNDEVLGGRVRVVSAAYALNSQRLEGMSGGQFLRSDASDSFSSGTLATDPGTTLNVAGTIQLSGVAVTSDAQELNKLDGAGPTVTAASLAALTNGGVADALHVHVNTNATLLDGIDSVQLLRSDASDSFTSGTLTFDPSTTVDVNGALSLDGSLQIDGDGSDGNQFIYFADGGSPTAESIAWDDTDVRFEMSHDLALAGSIRTGSTSAAETLYNVFGSGTPDLSLGSVGDVFVGGKLEAGGVIYTRSKIIVGDATPTDTVSYSSIGEAANKDEAAVSAVNDLYVEGDVEVDATLSLNGDLRIDNDGPDGVQQSIYFFDGASPTAEFLRFQTDQFILSDDLTFEQSLETSRNISNSGGISIQKDTDNNSSTTLFRVFTNAGTIEQMRINDGDEAATLFDGTVTANGIDYAEAFKPVEADLAPGDVVSLALGSPHHCTRTVREHDPNLLGVVSGRPGYVTGLSFDAENEADASLAKLRAEARIAKNWDEEERLTGLLQELAQRTHRAVALLGRLPVRVDGAFGTIAPGDRLTSSPTPGHAMVMRDAGPSLGIALEPWTSGERGQILVFVQPGWYDASPSASGATSRDAAAGDSGPPASEIATSSTSVPSVTTAGAGGSMRAEGVSGGRSPEVFRVDERGNVWAKGSFRPASMDVAEYFKVIEPVETGDVLVASRETPGALRRGTAASDPAVVGIVSGEPGVLLGSDLTPIAAADRELSAALDAARLSGNREEESRLWRELEARFESAHAPVALAGTTRCKADAGYGSIQVGDLLTVSPTVGHAMRAQNPAPGTVIAKALEPLASGTGVIRVLVMPR